MTALFTRAKVLLQREVVLIAPPPFSIRLEREGIFRKQVRFQFVAAYTFQCIRVWEPKARLGKLTQTPTLLQLTESGASRFVGNLPFWLAFNEIQRVAVEGPLSLNKETTYKVLLVYYQA